MLRYFVWFTLLYAKRTPDKQNEMTTGLIDVGAYTYVRNFWVDRVLNTAMMRKANTRLLQNGLFCWEFQESLE